MSLDVYLTPPDADEPEVWAGNITHNLQPMWEEAGVLGALYESDGKRAAEVLPALREGAARMAADPTRYEAHNAPNGWGLYRHALPWLVELIQAFEANPDAIVRTSQ